MDDELRFSIQIVATMAIEEISELTGIKKEKVFYDFMASNTCEILYNEKTHLWAEGPSSVADMYIEEKGLKTIEKP